MHDCGALAREVIARCQTLARFSEDDGSIRRTFLSPPMRDCHQEIARWVAPLGATTRVDAVGNLRIVYSPNGSGVDAAPLPRLLMGSHLDTVPNAGAYDGVLGVVLAISLLTPFQSSKLPFAFEIIGFSEEEGVRFNTPFIGSRAFVGSLNEELLKREDVKGISVRTAIENFGLNSAEISLIAIDKNVLGYLEFHIEQGPVLESVGLPLGVVEAIAGQSRLEFAFVGHANHAGTTPMNLRHDALAGAAEWISAVECHAQHASEHASGLVATVGNIQAKPGASNVIAGETRLSLDVRHPDDAVRKTALDYFVRRAEDVATRRGLSVRWKLLTDQPAVRMDSFLVSQVEEAVRRAGCAPFRMVSGAGHDAMILAQKIPSAIIFLRTPGGISHDPQESVRVEDVAKAIECGLSLVEQLASASKFRS